MTKENLTTLKVGEEEHVLVVLEDAADFQTETNEVYLVPKEWAEEHLKQVDGFEISNDLRNEIVKFQKVSHIKSFWYSNN